MQYLTTNCYHTLLYVYSMLHLATPFYYTFFSFECIYAPAKNLFHYLLRRCYLSRRCQPVSCIINFTLRTRTIVYINKVCNMYVPAALFANCSLYQFALNLGISVPAYRLPCPQLLLLNVFYIRLPVSRTSVLIYTLNNGFLKVFFK